MSLKDLLFEEVEVPSNDDDINVDDILSSTDSVDAIMPEAETTNIVEDTYSANNLTTKDRSIFKVEELSSTLPNEMQTDIKKQTIIGILSSFQLSVDEVINDGEIRKATLLSVNENVTNQITSEIEVKQAEIEELKAQIASKEKEITDSKDTLKLYQQQIETEVERIDELLKFIN